MCENIKNMLLAVVIAISGLWCPSTQGSDQLNENVRRSLQNITEPTIHHPAKITPSLSLWDTVAIGGNIAFGLLNGYLQYKDSSNKSAGKHALMTIAYSTIPLINHLTGYTTNKSAIACGTLALSTAFALLGDLSGTKTEPDTHNEIPTFGKLIFTKFAAAAKFGENICRLFS